MNDPFQEGQYIEDQYLLIRWLGMGGYGEVWLARDISMRDTEENHDVAIKIVDVSGMSDKEIERAQRECEFGIKLDIPGVVKVIRTIYNDKVSQFFIIMRLMQGDLAEQIYSDTPISFAQALKWAIDLCDTLERVHNRRVIHRDIKPQNILLDSKDHVYFCDFGIARITTESLLSSSTTNVTSSSTTASALSARVGSPDYKAPEVKAGHKAYFASDVYSLCAVFFELWLVTRYSIYEDTDRILLRKEFLRRLQKKYVNTPPICREKLADAILQGLLPIRKQRVRLVELRKALREVQQCLNSTEKLTPVPMPIIEEKSNTDHVLAEEACPIIQRGNKLPLAVFPSSPFLEDQKPIEEVLPKTYREHAEEVNVVAWSPDARCLGSAGSAIYVRRATDEGRNIPYRDHSHKITAMVWSPDSRYIASVSTGSESIINIWDTVNKMTMVTYTTNIGYIMALKWFASELYVALVNTDGIHIWNADTKQHIASYKGHMKLVRAVTWSPDGQFIASASSDKTIRVWNASTGSELCTCTTQAAAVDLIAWSPNGQYLASAGIDQTVQIWDATTGKNIFTYYGHSYAIYALAWSPDSKCIASASGDRTVQVWNALTGDNVFVYQGHSHEVLSLAWSSDGTRIASAGRDRTVQVWASPAQTRVFTYRDSHAQLDTLVWLPKEDTEQRIATGHKDGTIHVYSVPPGREEFTYQLHSAEITSLTRSPDGQFIASASKDGTVQIWHLTLKQKKRIYSHHSNEVYTVAWSPNGKYIAFAGTDRMIQVWDVAKERKFSTYEHHSNDVYSLAWSPDGKRIASASKDKTLQVWDSGRGGRVYINQNLPHEVYTVAWSPNGQYIASAGKSRFVQVWNAATWSAVSIYDASPFGAVCAVAWSPNGQYIASASYGTVQVWNAFTKETLLTHHLHLGEVNALAWSPDGLYVASVGNDRTLRVWQLDLG